MGRFRQTPVLAAFALVLGLAACDVGVYGDDVGGGADGSVANLPLAFNGQISQDFMMGGCMTCHGQTPLNNEYQLISYQTAIVAVVPNDPANSSLITEMDPGAAPRPEHTSVATQARLTLYTNWVNAGAPENAPTAVIDAGP